MQKISFDTSSELHICRFDNGIKLIRRDEMNTRENTYRCQGTGHTIMSILQSPFAVFFEDMNHVTLHCNDITADAYNFHSAKRCIGKKWTVNFKRKNLNQVLISDEKIVTNNLKVIENNSYSRKDGDGYETLSIRMPLYNADNKITGLFGCAIILGKNALDKSIELIKETGLLNATNISTIAPARINNQSLTKRETDCLKLTVRGKSANAVAKQLGISQRTVEEYLNNIKLKLRVTSKSELIDIAIDYFNTIN